MQILEENRGHRAELWDNLVFRGCEKQEKIWRSLGRDKESPRRIKRV